jgi:uncharacterized metal-binding protein
MKESLRPECAFCGVEVRLCRSKNGTGPKFCPTRTKGRELRKGLKNLEKTEVMRFPKAASLQEAECYVRRDEKPFVMRPTKTRVEETIEFAGKMGYKKLGVAFCAGLFMEGKTLVQILEKNGFEVTSVCCKVGGVPKEFLGLKDTEKVRIGTEETMCNPITQAEILNAAGTEFNILVGLCVGHDALFLKQAKAMTTVLVAKDRVLGHNPVAALYGAKGYFQRLMNP